MQTIAVQAEVSADDRLLPKILFAIGGAICFTPCLSPPIALTLGAVLAIAVEHPFGPGAHRLSKWLLQGCVVLLGFKMNLPVVLRAGASGAMFAAVAIGITLGLGHLLGKWLKISNHTSILISAGTAICGGSAIAAVGSVIGAEEGDLTVAMGTVFILNAVALYLFPVVGHALHLTDHQFGVWAGVAIHDVSSVVAASSRYGTNALEIATAVKLARALWIVPVTLVMAIVAKKQVALGSSTVGFDAARQQTPGKLQVPWFVGLFLLASICRSYVPGIAGIAPVLSVLTNRGLTFTLFLIGSGLSLSTLKAVGFRTLAQGTALWVFVSVSSLVVIML